LGGLAILWIDKAEMLTPGTRWYIWDLRQGSSYSNKNIQSQQQDMFTIGTH
jgi:hypothetical protein